MRVTDETILAALFDCASNREAAKAVGLSERAFYSRIRSPEFQRKLAEEKAQILEHASNAAESRINAAVNVMAEVMLDTENSGSVRTQAADALIRASLKLLEIHDISRRLEALERNMEDDR